MGADFLVFLILERFAANAFIVPVELVYIRIRICLSRGLNKKLMVHTIKVTKFRNVENVSILLVVKSF